MKSCGSAHGRRTSGLTLVEVIVAIAILAVGLSAGLAVFGVAVGYLERGTDRASAALLADSVLADLAWRLDARRVAALGEGRPVVWESGRWAPAEGLDQSDSRPVRRLFRAAGDRTSKDRPRLVYDLDLVSLAPDGRTFLAEVTVRWTEAGQARGETFRTIVPVRAGVAP